MAVLDDLPNEILVQVLGDLRVLDLQTFLVGQTTCRRFRVLVQDLLLLPLPLLLTPTPAPTPAAAPTAAPGPDPPPPSRVHPLLAARFRPLFDTAAAFTGDERRAGGPAARSMYLSLQGDYLFPFRRMPCWARSHRRRAVAARPEASWRGLSITEGRTPITHLDIVKDYAYDDDNGGGDRVQYSQLELPPAPAPAYLTMGMLYDVLLSGEGTFGGATGAWELLLDRRLRSFDVLDDYECFITDDPQLVEVGPRARGCAILHVQGGDGCEKAPRDHGGARAWKPLGPVPRCLPWQGPRQDVGREFVLLD